MALSINPLLLEKPNDIRPKRNWARANAVEPAVSFSQKLEDTNKQSNIGEPVKITEVKNETKEIREINSTDIKPASSWRVDRSAAEVKHEVNDLSLDDFWDIINPLHHIPIVGTIYREMTGDEIKPFVRVTGDILFAAATGSVIVNGILSVIGAAYEQHSGEEPAMQVADVLFGKNKELQKTETVMLAEASGVSSDKETPLEETEQTLLAQANSPPAPESAVSVTPQKVQVALLDDSKEAAVNNEVTTKEIAKPPYGGVMDTAAAAKNQKLASVSPATPKGMRIGDKIYVNPPMNNSMRLAANAVNRTHKEQKADISGAITKAESEQKNSLKEPAGSTIAQSLPSDSRALGQMMHQSAEASATGRPLPPELVRDMMLMAIDKYKTAGNLSSGNITLPATN